MKIDIDSIDKLSDVEVLTIIFQDGLIYYIISIILLLIGLIMTINYNYTVGTLSFIIAIISMILGVKNIFLRKDNRKNYIKSKLVSKTIKEAKKNGVTLTKEDIDNIRFEYDPLFHEKIESDIHKKQKAEFLEKVMKAESKVNELENKKINEITRLNNERWTSTCEDKLKYNLTEGKVCINQNIYLFSEIKGAEINKKESYNVVTVETGKSKKHASLGGALTGGIIFGPIGAIVGGSTLGKTTIKGNSISNSIPVCNYIGVIVDINGFKSEIVILDERVNQSSSTYKNAVQNAENIISELHFLSTQPVPKEYIKVEDEKTVLEIEKSIEKAKIELKELKETKEIN